MSFDIFMIMHWIGKTLSKLTGYRQSTFKPNLRKNLVMTVEEQHFSFGESITRFRNRHSTMGLRPPSRGLQITPFPTPVI